MTSFRDRALADVRPEDLQAMRAENETLFVEHKSALREPEQFNVVKAAASFANGLGGWILIGVRDGVLVAGQEGEWQPPEGGVFVDQVREALDRQIDPPVPFAAAIRTIEDHEVGVIRIYQSVDTPHIVTQNGGIYVREVAKDRRANRAANDAYEPTAVRSQGLLLELSRRGREARARADGLIDWPGTPWINETMNLQYTRTSEHVIQTTRPGAGATLRLAPLNRHPRMEDWAVSEEALGQLREAAARLVHKEDFSEGTPRVNASGISVSDRPPEGESPLQDLAARSWNSHASTDAAGALAVALNFGDPQPAPDRMRLHRTGFRRLMIDPLLREGVRMLQAAELFGRVRAHLFLSELGILLQVDEDGVLKDGPARLPLGGEIVIPSTSDLDQADGLTGDLGGLADRWSEDSLRSVGFIVLRAVD
jgi:hypothetical protein